MSQAATALLPATLLRRYKRFLADVRLPDGRELTVHCANPGSMQGLVHPGGRCWLSDSQNPKRKLRFSLEQVEVAGQRVCVNTARANPAVGEALRAGRLPLPFAPTEVRAEVRSGASRIDFLCTAVPDRARTAVPERASTAVPARPCTDAPESARTGAPARARARTDAPGRELWLEVKMVTLATPPLARFPDAQTERGRRHLDELVALHDPPAGRQAGLLLAVARADCTRFAPAREIDPGWAARLDAAREAGLWVRAFAFVPVAGGPELALAHELELEE